MWYIRHGFIRLYFPKTVVKGTTVLYIYVTHPLSKSTLTLSMLYSKVPPTSYVPPLTFIYDSTPILHSPTAAPVIPSSLLIPLSTVSHSIASLNFW